MASFVQKFGFSKKNGGGNSIQQEVILESMKEAQESLAAQISQDTSSASNIEVILTRGSKSLTSNIKTQESILLEQDIEENSLERLLKSIERASSLEELSALMQRYEELVASWCDKASKLSSEKRLKEYLSIIAALNMLQKMLQNPDLLFSGKEISERLQTGLISQSQAIESQAKVMHAQNQKLHEQTGQSSGQIMQAHVAALAIDKLPVSVLPLEMKGQMPIEQKPPVNQIQTESVKDKNILAPHIDERLSVLSQRIQEANALKDAELVPTTSIHSHPPLELSGIIKDNVIDITARLRERIEVESSTYKPLSKDALSQAHVCTAGCSHGHSHAAHQDVQPKMMGSGDPVSKGACLYWPKLLWRT
ncbi:MAG: hypothetical protein IPP74_02360 [Alphaproteobacteria bacterium]|nr:hypothetical protein [Alphaproteobacteria bacterium]